VKIAITVALILVLTAVGALGYTVLHIYRKPHLAASRGPSPSISPVPSATLGPYGHIATRKTDPAPLTVAQLYPASITAGSAPVTRAATSLSKDCSTAVTGSNLISALSAAGCDQAARATYLSSSAGLMGTIGVFNLRTAAAARTAARSAGPSAFVAQLKAKHGPTSKIGTGAGIEEAAAKGHYLILIWAELTSLKKPRPAQQSTLEQFMTSLLDKTANVSLTDRMLGGSS
jgi:hypothetical protein